MKLSLRVRMFLTLLAAVKQEIFSIQTGNFEGL
uniref:Uncharacterized protein n=1 Tax=Rhizophora mucronata TaxID=61149 RepID=A0A2P2NQH3_RHIMU